MTTRADFPGAEQFLEAQGREFRHAYYELVRTYGEDFLDYICAYDGTYGMVNIVPTDTQRLVIGELFDLMRSLQETPVDDSQRRIATARELGGYVDDLKTSRAAAWHERCGGRVPDTRDDGTVESAFRILARDFLGFRLLGGTHLSAVLGRHPVGTALFERLNDDDPLAAMFRDAVAKSMSENAEWQSRYPRSVALLPLWSDGQRSTLKFQSIPCAILTDSRVTKYVANDVVRDVQDATLAKLDLARRLSTGETVTVPTYVGLAGIRLSDDAEHVGLEGIRLRRSTPLDPGCLNGTTQVWTIAEIDTELKYLHTAVQDNPRPGDRSRVHIPDRTQEHTDIIDAHRRCLESKLERLRFALLLSSGVDDALASKGVSTTTDNPMTGSGVPMSSGLPHNAQAREISAAVAAELDKWLPEASTMPDHLLLPMRRLLRAAAERGDPVDSLVDAVVCWEGLFGANPEIRFQVTGAMSVLLEPDIEQRPALFKELGDLYSMRSGIVHGSVDVGAKKFSHEDATVQAQRTVALGISSFREVLSRSDLVELKESRQRSRRILLGF